MAITYQQAVQFMNGPIGSQIPRVARLLRPSNWNNLNKGLKAQYLNEIEGAMKDPIGYSFARLKEDVAGYVIYQNIPGGGGTAKAEAKDLKASIDKEVAFLQSNNQSVNDIMSAIDSGYSKGATSLNEQVNRMNQTSTIDKVADVALGVGLGVATGGLSLSDQIIANALLQAGQGANPQDIVRNVTATIAANSLTQGVPGVDASSVIPKTLNEINQKIASLAPNIVNPTVASALINAERQAVAAAITKQDVVKNAIAGAAGGTVADLSLLGLQTADPKINNALAQAISKSAAEYAQYKAAGFSDADALQKSITSYITQSQKIEADAAKAAADAEQAKKDTAGLTAEQVGIAQTYGRGGQYTGTEKALPEQVSTATAEQPTGAELSIVSGQRPLSATDTRTKSLPTQYSIAKESLPGGTTTATAGDDLSLVSTSTTPEEKTPEQQRRDMILTSLINKNVTTPLYSSKTKTVTQQGGPGTQALAQALRVGDVGAPVFGRDEEGRRAGWNLQSLRYMGDVGAEK